MKKSIMSLIELSTKQLGIEKLTLQVYSDNVRAVSLYKSFGFNIVRECELIDMEFYHAI